MPAVTLHDAARWPAQNLALEHFVSVSLARAPGRGGFSTGVLEPRGADDLLLDPDEPRL